MSMTTALKQWIPPPVRKLIRSARNRIFIWYDFPRARQRLLSSAELTDDEKQLLSKISLQVCPADISYHPRRGGAMHYLSAGLSAVRCIRRALGSSGHEPATIKEILDFASGYGRVLRFLPAMFSASHITAVEIDSDALDFCRRTFSVTTVLSKMNFGKLSLPQRFDLIWCSSLFTHIPESSAIELLKFFHDHLTEQGLCVFTTHGRLSVELIQSGAKTYGLTEDARRKVVQEFQAAGYGYADYPYQSGYGVSIVSHERMAEMAKAAGRWVEKLFIEHGWDNHQDVYAFAMPMLPRGVRASR